MTTETILTAPARTSHRSERRRTLQRIAIRFSVVIAAALIWEITARISGSVFFPPLSSVLVRAQQKWFSGPPSQLFMTQDFLDVIVPSMQRLIPGLVLAIIFGLVLGFSIGLVGWVSDLLYPLVHFIRSIPASAKVPLFIILLGITYEMKLWLIVVAVALPIVVNVVDGVRSTEPTLLDSAKIFRVPPHRTILHIVLPSAMPKIFASLRLATAIGLVVLVLEEMLASSDGIGFYLLYSQRQFRLDDMWAAVILIGLIGYLLSLLLDFAERRLLRWHTQARAGAQ